MLMFLKIISFFCRVRLRGKGHAPGLYLSTSPSQRACKKKVNNPQYFHKQGLALILSNLTTIHAPLVQKPYTLMQNLLSTLLQLMATRRQARALGSPQWRQQTGHLSCLGRLPLPRLRLHHFCPSLYQLFLIMFCIKTTAACLLHSLPSVRRHVWITWTSSVSKNQLRKARVYSSKVQQVSLECKVAASSLLLYA